MQIEDILGLIKFGMFSEWEGVFKLFCEFLLPYIYFFFLPSITLAVSCYGLSSFYYVGVV